MLLGWVASAGVFSLSIGGCGPRRWAHRYDDQQPWLCADCLGRVSTRSVTLCLDFTSRGGDFACVFLLRFISQLLGVLPGISQWWRHRRQRQEQDQVRNALLELIEERYDAFDVSIPKLQRSGWLSESAALTAQRASLRRKLTSAAKADQLKKIWRNASQVFKSEPSVQLVYAQSLARVGAQGDGEKVLIDLASRGWSQAATDLMCTWTLEDPRTLLTRLGGADPIGQ